MTSKSYRVLKYSELVVLLEIKCLYDHPVPLTLKRENKFAKSFNRFKYLDVLCRDV